MHFPQSTGVFQNCRVHLRADSRKFCSWSVSCRIIKIVTDLFLSFSYINLLLSACFSSFDPVLSLRCCCGASERPHGAPFLFERSGTVRHNIQVSAEWQPKDGTWKNQDFEAEIKKLEKDAEERMDAKIEELMSQIATTGSKSK